jgi:hypothetical protein
MTNTADKVGNIILRILFFFQILILVVLLADLCLNVRWALQDVDPTAVDRRLYTDVMATRMMLPFKVGFAAGALIFIRSPWFWVFFMFYLVAFGYHGLIST